MSIPGGHFIKKQSYKFQHVQLFSPCGLWSVHKMWKYFNTLHLPYMINVLSHSAAFLFKFLGKNSALRYVKHLLGVSLLKNNMKLRVSDFFIFFFILHFFIPKVSVLWTSTLNYQNSMKLYFYVIWMLYINAFMI